MQDEYKKVRLLRSAACLPRRLQRYILTQFLDRILQRRPRVVHLIDDEHILSDQVGVLQGREVQPLRTRHLGANLLLGHVRVVREPLVQREPNRLDGDVWRTRRL